MLEVAEPIHCRIIAYFAADTLLYTVTLTFDLWPWTFAAYRLWRSETLYQIWTQSSNPRRSYCDFSVWPYDLEHCVTSGSGTIFAKFDLRQLFRAWIIAFFMLIRHITLWPRPLIRWPRNLYLSTADLCGVCSFVEQRERFDNMLLTMLMLFCLLTTRHLSVSSGCLQSQPHVMY